jgi:hypothetical protein
MTKYKEPWMGVTANIIATLLSTSAKDRQTQMLTSLTER